MDEELSFDFNAALARAMVLQDNPYRSLPADELDVAITEHASDG